MAKYKDGNFNQFPRQAYEKLKGLKTSSKWLFTVLIELEHKFTGHKEKFFFRSLQQLSVDSELSIDCVRKSLKELEQAGVIKKWQAHWIVDKKTGKKSEKHITAIQLLV